MTDIVTLYPVRRRPRRLARARAPARPLTFRQVANMAALVGCVLAIAACLLIPFAVRIAGVDLHFACAITAAPCVGLAILGDRQP